MYVYPKTSPPIKIGAKNVFVALPNILIQPKLATNSIGKPNKLASITPKLAPIEKRGVTSPP